MKRISILIICVILMTGSLFAQELEIINLPESIDLNVTPGSENAKVTRVLGNNGSD